MPALPVRVEEVLLAGEGKVGTWVSVWHNRQEVEVKKESHPPVQSAVTGSRVGGSEFLRRRVSLEL